MPGDLRVFFEQQRDQVANYMAAFTAKDPTDRAAFLAHWDPNPIDPTVIAPTILLDGQVVGHIMSYQEDRRCEITYWLGKEFWGQGIATQALLEFLTKINPTRLIHARAAKDNTGSLRVLKKCGFIVIAETRGFAHARGAEVDEFLLELASPLTKGEFRSEPLPHFLYTAFDLPYARLSK